MIAPSLLSDRTRACKNNPPFSPEAEAGSPMLHVACVEGRRNEREASKRANSTQHKGGVYLTDHLFQQFQISNIEEEDAVRVASRVDTI